MGEQYTIADIICFPWAHQVFVGYIHTSGRAANDFLSASQYKNVVAWVDRIKQRPAVQRGMTVCKNGVGKPWLEADK